MTISIVTVVVAAALIGLGVIIGRLSVKASPPNATDDPILPYGMGKTPPFNRFNKDRL